MASDAYCAICGAPSGASRLCGLHKAWTPAEQLRHHLANARTASVTFERAWEMSFNRVIWNHDTGHRRQWKEVLEGDMDQWRADYERVERPRRPKAYTEAFDLQPFVAA